jgi:hypothetical protein
VSFAEQLMLAVVLALGLFAGWSNATAGALFVAYWVVMGAYWGWGIVFPTSVGFLFDVTVLAVIYCKRPAFECFPYHSLPDQFCSLWLERSYWDRLVIALFPISWLTYVVPFGNAAWWILYIVALGQYLAAGAETLQAYLSTRTAKRASPPDPPGFMLVFGRETRPWVT